MLCSWCNVGPEIWGCTRLKAWNLASSAKLVAYLIVQELLQEVPQESPVGIQLRRRRKFVFGRRGRSCRRCCSLAVIGRWRILRVRMRWRGWMRPTAISIGQGTERRGSGVTPIGRVWRAGVELADRCDSTANGRSIVSKMIDTTETKVQKIWDFLHLNYPLNALLWPQFSGWDTNTRIKKVILKG